MSQATTVDETFSRRIYFGVHKIDVRYGCIMNCVSSLTAQALLRPRTECNFGSYEISAARPPHDRARACRGWRGLRRGERIVDGDGQEGMLMKAGGQVRDSSGRRGVGQDAARAWRGKDIGECRFKGTAGGQLSTDRRGEECSAWPCPTGRVGAGGAAGPRSCSALLRAEDASARKAGLIEPESL